MKINLIPISHPELKTIEIDNDVFLIGRLEDPFVSYDTEISADMSRRHAKIFVENGQLCIVDLESLNGTTLNNLSLEKKALALKNGDVVEFARHLSYKVEFATPDLDATILAGHHQEISLTLEPLDKASGLDILVITGFPFLISKEAGIFASFKTDFASQTSRISRRHAYVVLENNELKLIDKSSTNGTIINGSRVDEDKPVTLKNGDIVSFAGDFFTYIIKLASTDQTSIDQTVLRPPAKNSNSNKELSNGEKLSNDIEPRTTFVNEPSPYLDILCDDASSNQSKQKNSEKENIAGKNKKSGQKKTSFIVSFIRQCSLALADEKPKRNRKKGILIFLILVSIMGTAAYYYLNDNTREIRQLLKTRQYSEAAALTTELLITDPDNKTLQELSTNAILNNFVPTWVKSLKDTQYQDAEKILENTKGDYPDLEELAKSINILQWVTEMHQFMANRNENGGVAIFKDENKIQSLLLFWNSTLKENRKTLAMIARNVSAFKPGYEQVLSNVRLLENDQNLYLKAIDKLKTDILEQLKAGQIQELHSTVTYFEKKYSAVSGLDDLKLDIYQFVKLNEAVKNKNIQDIAILNKKLEFKTPLFIKYSQSSFAEQLPSEQFTEQYSEALKSWEAGETETAIKYLHDLSNSNWGSVADKKLEHFQTVLTGFSALEASKGNEKYVEELFSFHALLKLPEDGYFLNLIEQDFQNNEQLALEKAKNSFNQAQLHWDKYVDNNGIGGILRLEETVSKAFKVQANNLSLAVQNILYSLKIYENLHADIPQDINQLSATIINEAEKQRKWLIDLELILKPETLKKKLDLLSVAEGQ